MAFNEHRTEVGESVGQRLAAAAVAHRDAQEVASKVGAIFRSLVVEARDSGMRETDVARIAGVARSRVHRIIYDECRRAS